MKLEVLRQLLDGLVNGSSRLECKGHVIHKDRQDDPDIVLEVDVDGCI
jgi:hypothetical protein